MVEKLFLQYCPECTFHVFFDKSTTIFVTK